ncbi:hypothetical protein Tco_0721362 [Tanacetum coccineum]
MMTLQFADTHNLVVFLAKPAESEGFEQIVDFLNAHNIKYALTVNPTIYTSCIKQFWATVKVKTVNEEQQLQALVDRKKIVVTEASVRRDLQLDDEEDTFYNALNANDQDSLNSVAGGIFLDKMPRECLKIIESKSKPPMAMFIETTLQELRLQAAASYFLSRNPNSGPPMVAITIRPPVFLRFQNNQSVSIRIKEIISTKIEEPISIKTMEITSTKDKCINLRLVNHRFYNQANLLASAPQMQGVSKPI